MRQAGRVDSNQAEIVEALRKVGAVVLVTSNMGQGVADLICGYRGRVTWLEVKSDRGRLTEAEKRFQEMWKGNYYVVRTAEEALNAIGI